MQPHTEEVPRKQQEADRPEWIDELPEEAIEAATKYARSQGVGLDDERVRKYVNGLTGRTGDFGGREQQSQVGWRQK